MREKGLGSKRNLSAAQRFYRMTLEQNANAFYPAILALAKARLEAFVEGFIASVQILTVEAIYRIDISNDIVDSVWNIVSVALFTGLMGILFRLRRNRAA
jgi:hypothetical protein